MLKVSTETLKFMTEAQKQELPRLVERLEQWSPRGHVSEGCKYVVHYTFDEFIPNGFDQESTWQLILTNLGASDYFTGLVFGKPKTIFFFMPLFD